MAASEARLPFGDSARPADEPARPPGAAPLTVSALVGRIKEALLDAFPRPLAVVGQISNFKRHSSGHLYFSLKDAGAAIDAVMFRGAADRVRFDLADGLEVVAHGRVDLYERQGRLQLYVERLEEVGTGALELEFRRLKERLAGEGLFDTAGKKTPPTFPRAVGLVTSPTGAAVRDIAHTLRRRWPAARVYLVGVRVQGDLAAGEIAQAISLLDASAGRLGIDTIILARGGGSLEDLWAFNEEVVARAIFSAGVPIITGVGHEVDFSIADFVADVQAATPTAAAELAVPDGRELRRRCQTLAGRLGRRMGEIVATARGGLTGVERSVVFRDPASRVRSARQRLDELTVRMRQGLADRCRDARGRLHSAAGVLAAHRPPALHERSAARLERVRRDLAWALGGKAKLAGDALTAGAARLAAAHPRHRLRLARHRVGALARQLEAMSYRNVLRRGYTVTRLAGEILRSAGRARAGDLLETELTDGRVASRVTEAASPPAGEAGAAPPPQQREDDR